MDKVEIYKDTFEYLCRSIEKEINATADLTLDEWAPVAHSITKNYTDLLIKVLFSDSTKGE